METVTVGLIEGRHSMPVEDYIFNEAIENIHDYKSIEKTVMNFLINSVGIKQQYDCCINQAEYGEIFCYRGNKSLVVYVTGLTPVTAALIKCCAFNGVNLTLMNYDTESGSYKEQVIFA